MYDYPRYSKLLSQPLSPDFDQVAQAFARKFNWRIQPGPLRLLEAIRILGLEQKTRFYQASTSLRAGLETTCRWFTEKEG